MTITRFTTIIFIALLITGCAGQATRSSSSWQSEQQYLYVSPISSGLYKLDEFNTTQQGLKELLEGYISEGIRPEIVIYAPLQKNYANQAEIAEIAEQLDLVVLRYGLFGHLDIDSKTLREWAGEP